MKRLSLVTLVVLIASFLVSVAGAPAASASNGSSRTFISKFTPPTPDPSKVGQSVHVHVYVEDVSDSCTRSILRSCDPPTGTVDLYDGPTITANKIGSAPLVKNGPDPGCDSSTLDHCWSEADFDVIFRSAGDHTVTAKYVPGNFDASQFSYTQRVEKISTTTSLIQSSTNTAPGQPVTFTATVASDDPLGQTIVPSQVQFEVDGSPYGAPVSLSGSTPTATLATSTLSAGTHFVQAHYLGSSAFGDSRSRAVLHTVGNTTTTALTSSVNPSAAGQPVTFTATITSSGTPAPTGTVTFKDGSTILGSAPLSGPMASFTTSTLAVGTHSITAIYNGDSSNGGSTSASLTQTVLACTVTAPAGGGPAVGATGNDVICGSANADDISGGGGDDTIYGGGGNDRISGGDGNDTIYGGDGNDQLSGGAGNDHLYGEAGAADYASGGDGTDACSAEYVASCES